jgi:hypothetical protein
MSGNGLEDMIKSVVGALKFFSSQEQSRAVLKFAQPLSTVGRKLFGSGIFVYWFILRRFCNGIGCLGLNIRMLANDELVKMLEATVVYFNILSHGFSVGDEGEIISRNAQSSGRNLESKPIQHKAGILSYTQNFLS